MTKYLSDSTTSCIFLYTYTYTNTSTQVYTQGFNVLKIIVYYFKLNKITDGTDIMNLYRGYCKNKQLDKIQKSNGRKILVKINIHF